MARKEEIRQAAIKVMAGKGFYSSRIQSIADEAGLAIGTIYIYFDSKEAILDYIFEMEYKKRQQFIRVLKKKNLDLPQTLQAFLMFYINEMKTNPDTVKLLIQESINPSLQNLRWVKKTLADTSNIFKWILEDAKIKGQVRNIDIDLIGAAIHYSIRSIAYNYIEDKNLEPSEEELNQVITFIIKGVGPL